MDAASSVIGLVTLQATTDSSTSDPFESIGDFFDSGLWGVISVMLRLFVLALWAALVWWTYQDARRRIESPGLVAASTALSVVLPFLGTIIYLIVRPPEYLDEARERELELLALEHRLGELGDSEGQQIVGRILAREGLASGGDPAVVRRALRQAGVASLDDVRDIDQRLTELEFRLRAGGSRAPTERTEARPETRPRRRELPPAGNDSGDTGRVSRWRRPRDQETYD